MKYWYRLQLGRASKTYAKRATRHTRSHIHDSISITYIGKSRDTESIFVVARDTGSGEYTCLLGTTFLFWGWWKCFGTRWRRWLPNTMSVLTCHQTVHFHMVNFVKRGGSQEMNPNSVHVNRTRQLPGFSLGWMIGSSYYSRLKGSQNDK